MNQSARPLHIIVARHKEDLAWLHDLQDMCVVYDKDPSTAMNQTFHHRIVPLPNTGREADTYIKHIVRSYPYFADYNVFTQAHLEDHVASVPSFVTKLKDIASGSKTDIAGYEGLNEMRVKNGWGTFKDFRDSTHSGLPIREYWFRLFPDPPVNNEIRCNYCGIFMVSKPNILFHSLRFYEEIEKLCREDPVNAPYVLERLWTTIFDGKTASHLDHPTVITV